MATSDLLNRKDKIRCLIRGEKVAATPEEEVRQALIRRMIEDLGYPKGQLAVELSLGKLPHLTATAVPDCRLDLLLFQAVSFRPLLLVECKAVPLTEKVLHQVVGYNYYVRAPFLLVVNQRESKLGYYREEGLKFADGIPTYTELLRFC